jgi:uncharacterized protein YcfJ
MTDTNPRDLHPMTNQIPIEEALKLVQFKQASNGSWYVENVKGDVCGYVFGNVNGKVWGNVGSVGGTIAGREIETPEQKFRRLLDETENQELIEAFNQLEESND